jgi:glycosyltransferase involved in cell wall biosynthesis
MKLYAICLVKNEDDVIEQTLLHAKRYCDKIFVIDNGSSDETWRITQRLGGQFPQIVPFRQMPVPYDEGLRWLAYDAHHRELTCKDWWLILDGDELLGEDPRPVIERAMRERADIVNAWQIQFYFTEKDYEAHLNGSDSREQPITERRRYYRIDWREPRLFRNQTKPKVIFRQSKLLSAGNTWGSDVVRLKGKVARRHIYNRHYQYRDPIQIEKRLRLRYGNQNFAAQVNSLDWHSVMRESRALEYHEDGKTWRFSLGGLMQVYSGWLRYVVTSRLSRVRRRLATVIGV